MEIDTQNCLVPGMFLHFEMHVVPSLRFLLLKFSHLFVQKIEIII